jgi:RNA polymerase sigma-70 factor (ECF subfamily)
VRATRTGAAARTVSGSESVTASVSESASVTASASDSASVSASAPESDSESDSVAVSASESDSVSASATPSLSPELTLLRRAQGARRAGDPSRALALLDAHARAFPHAVLAPEREAARVLTLCDLGRLAEGRAAQAAFLASHPESPLAPRVRAACGR